MIPAQPNPVATAECSTANPSSPVKNHSFSRRFLGAALCGFVLMAGCTTKINRRWLSLFFDGVPPLSGTTNATTLTSANAALTNGGALLSAPVAPRLLVHLPYQNRECGECHQSKFSQRLKGTPREVCFGCHDDFLAQAKIRHAPAESGDCLACHHPHESTNQFLLVLAGKALCFDCHDDFLQQAKVKHKPVESGQCLECHDPHQSATKGLLKRPAKELCSRCHGDFLAKFKYRHAPADSGDCLICHTPHQSAEPGLLLAKGAKLCEECHEQKEMAAVRDHGQIGDFDCTKCHNPHGGDNKGLLKAGTVKLTAAPASGR